MKIKFLLYLLMLVLTVSFTFTACEDKEEVEEIDPENGTENGKNQRVNKWIYEEMNEWYYWNDKIPAKDKLDFNLDPEDFFENHILFDYQDKNKDGEGDRFSWMEPYEHSKKKSASTMSDIGFDYIPSWYGNNIVLIVSYVKPNTIAAKGGIKRGFIINRVDKQVMTEENWYTALDQNKSSYELEYSRNAAQLLEGIFVKSTLKVTDNYRENPVLMDSIYNDPSGRKIGYIVFNTFGDEQDEQHLKDDIYLIERLTRFEKEGITDLVLDLRYNGGGLVQTAVYLGSALVPQRKIENIFQRNVYNKTFQQKIETYPEGHPTRESWLNTCFVDNIYWKGDDKESATLNAIPKLGDKINTLCVIGTRYTASSSEMIINCLKPYFTKASKKMYLIGDTTVGKNVGSWSIEPEDEAIEWKLQPITFQSYNVDYKSDYAKGFAPDVPAQDFEDLELGLSPLGNTQETLLAAAIDKINNKTTVKTKIFSESNLEPLPSSEIESKKGGSVMLVGEKDTQELMKLLESLNIE